MSTTVKKEIDDILNTYVRRKRKKYKPQSENHSNILNFKLDNYFFFFQRVKTRNSVTIWRIGKQKETKKQRNTCTDMV